MTKKQNLPIIILDFDGVILESVDVKTRAFRELFSFTPKHVDEIVDFHLQYGGMSRFDKFRYFYKNILKEPLSDKQYDFLCNRFSELVFDGVLRSTFVPGAKNFLKHFSTKTSLFVVSATPASELTEIIRQRGLLDYFKAIYGAPRTKQECIEEILMNIDCLKENAIFVGDALNDYKAAKKAGVHFIGRVRSGSINIFKEYDDVEIVVSDLDEIRTYLEDLNC
jgi:HAD superfamily hydrolase (TIGR01549 family)